MFVVGGGGQGGCYYYMFAILLSAIGLYNILIKHIQMRNRFYFESKIILIILSDSFFIV